MNDKLIYIPRDDKQYYWLEIKITITKVYSQQINEKAIRYVRTDPNYRKASL